jgi:hypothetical protein
MAEIHLGNQFDFLRHEIELRSIGRVTVLRGQGVVVGIGTSVRGPVMELYGIMNPSQVRSVYHAGPLKEDLETALDQGCSIVFGLNIRGAGHSKAALELNDSQLPGRACGTLIATGAGAWGNIPTITILDGDYNGSNTEFFSGDGSVGPYALHYDDLKEARSNYVKVAGSNRTIIYNGIPDRGEVKLDKVAGTITFAESEAPNTAQQIEVKYKYASRKVIVQDEGAVRPLVFNNITSLKMLSAKMRNCSICTFEPKPGATHLPRVMDPITMTGGSDGAEVTIDDWEAAFNIVLEKMPSGVVPTAVFVTDYEVNSGTMDIVPLMDAFLWKMADRLTPCQGFVPLDPDRTAQDMADFADGYSNLWMTLIGNAYSETERNLAPARAGMEAALPLGTSAATNSNSLKGVDGLLFQFNEAEREILTYGQVDVLIKETGVHPYVGITTDTDTNFKRCVDVRTIAECIVLADGVVKKFLNERRTLTNLNRLNSSIVLLYDKLLKMAMLDDFSVEVTPNHSDKNAVDIHIMLQPVGHMERFYTTMDVGYWSDKIAE